MVSLVTVAVRLPQCCCAPCVPVTYHPPNLSLKGVRSVIAAGTAAMTDRTPFKERFGGWYVTGTHGAQQHWGNLTATVTKETIGDAKAYVRRLNLIPGANVLDLKPRFNTEPYLTPNSDIASLMVM